MENKFNQDDLNKFVDFLNSVATNANFNFKTDELIKYFKLLSHMQQTILPKMKANIAEVLRVIEPQEKENKGE